LYKCNQYFDLEEIPETDKLKLASYYLDGLALYWHQNYTRNLEGHEVTWAEYVDALCCRFGGQKDPLEELTEHKQEGDLEGYIRCHHPILGDSPKFTFFQNKNKKNKIKAGNAEKADQERL
jgi:hypothetical protein